MKGIIVFFSYFKALLKALFDKINSSLQNKLMYTYVSVTIAPIVAIGIISYVVSAGAISKEVEKSNNQLIEEIAGNVSSYIDEINRTSNIFVSKVINSNLMYDLNKEIDYGDKIIMDSLSEMNEFLYTTQSSRGDLLSLRLLSAKGDFISCTYNIDRNVFFSYSSPRELEWFEKVLNDETGNLLLDIHPLDISSDLAITASRTAINPLNGKKNGTILFDLDFGTFKKLCSKFELRSGSELFIMNNEGNYFYHTQNHLIGNKVNSDILSLIRDSNYDKGSLIKDIYHKKTIVSYVELPYNGWILGGTVPVETLTTHISTSGRITILICVFSLLLVTLLSLAIARHISKPIIKLSNLMYDVEKGNFNVSISDISNKDEIGHLSRSFNSMIGTINQLVKIRYETEIRKKNAELKALIMQINPHFLYNTLEIISAIADEKSNESVYSITQSLGNMLRYSIDLKDEIVLIEDEIKNIRNYLLIQKIRYEDTLEVQMDIDETAKNCVVTKLTLQPLIENAIRHGTEKKIGRAFIHISVKRNSDSITIQISDNGVGMSPEKVEELKQNLNASLETGYDTSSSKSIGLKNVYARLKILFGEKLGFEIHSAVNEGTTFEITIPPLKKTDFK